MSTATEGAARRLGTFASSLSLTAVPPQVVRLAVRCLLDTLGVLIAGAGVGPARKTRAFALAIGATGCVSVVATVQRLHPAPAAMANAAAAHALDFDDSSYAGYVHGSAVVAPAVLAAAEAQGIAGADLLAAFIAGMEVEFALGEAATRALYDRGWFTTALLGVIGAAAAASRAFQLNPSKTARAIALAAAQAGNLRGCIGSDAKPYLAARAAEGGVSAALLAAAGMTGPLDIFESHLGFANVANGGTFEAGCLSELGSVWRLETPGIDVKQYPICLSAHAAVEAALEFAAENPVAPEAIAEILCEVPPVVAVNLKHPEPATVAEAQFSLPYTVATALVCGELGLAQFSPDALADPRVRALMRKVSMRVMPDWNNNPACAPYPEGARLTLRMTDGRNVTQFTGAARGAAGKPLADAALDAKFLHCTRKALGAEAARQLLDAIRALSEGGAPTAIYDGLRAAIPDEEGDRS